MPSGVYKRTSSMKTGKRKRTQEEIEAMKKRFSKEKHPNWKGGISQDREHLTALNKKSRLRRWEKCPWEKTYSSICSRCKYQKNSLYYKKGIQCQITKKELRKLWFRDKAYLMQYPTIDRFDNKKNYMYNNCQYLEFSENRKKQRGTRCLHKQRK